MKPTQNNNLEEITNLAVNVGKCLIKHKHEKTKESEQNAENALADYKCALEDICKNDKSDKKNEFLDFFSSKKLIAPIIDKLQTNMKELNEEGIEVFFRELFAQEVEKNKDFLTTYFLRDQLIKQVQAAVTYYKNYSTDYCRLSFVNRHGNTGRKRATDFLANIQSLDSSEDIMAAIVKHLKEGEGRKHPHSFRTVLLASFEPEFMTKHHNLTKKTDPLKEFLTNVSDQFTIFLEKIFPQTKTWAKTAPGKPASSIYEIKP